MIVCHAVDGNAAAEAAAQTAPVAADAVVDAAAAPGATVAENAVQSCAVDYEFSRLLDFIYYAQFEVLALCVGFNGL